MKAILDRIALLSKLRQVRSAGGNVAGQRKADSWSRIFSMIALVFSGVTLIVLVRTYTLTHRPYVGIIKVKHQFEGQPKVKRINWAIVIKNTGSIPARGKVEKRHVSVTMNAVIHDVPLKTVSEASIFLMPGAVVTLFGDFPGNHIVPIRDVLSGDAVLTDTIRISYEPSGAIWWNSKYFYEARLQFLALKRPFFTTTVTDAN